MTIMQPVALGLQTKDSLRAKYHKISDQAFRRGLQKLTFAVSSRPLKYYPHALTSFKDFL